MKIILGSASKELGTRIAQLLGVAPVSVFSKTFPDGESYVGLKATLKAKKRL